ncbi:MAG: helix-turn-helix domain-containing protein [Roseburia sp. 1XD42-69]
MRNPKLVPYETIIRATSGEPEAIDEVLRHYSKRSWTRTPMHRCWTQTAGWSWRKKRWKSRCSVRSRSLM